MKNRIVLNSPRLLGLKKKKNKELRRKMFLLIIFLILILVGLSFLSRWQKLNINDIEVSGNKVIDTDEIKSIANKDISGYYFGIFPKTNFLLYPRGEIEKELTDKYKRIKDISFSLKNLTTLDISLTERTALYMYCGDKINLTSDLPSDILSLSSVLPEDNKCYFMDDSGYIFDEAPYFSGEVYLKFYGTTDINSAGDPSGSYFSQSNFAKLITLKNTLEEINIKPAIFYIEENGDIEMFLTSSSETQMGPEIIFKTDSDFEQIAENLQTVLTTDPFQTEFKNKYSSLLYIDLRYGNKVYYKFK